MRSRPGPAFSNGTEHEMWSANWCDVCKRDAIYRSTGENGCSLILTALLGEIPDEWIEQPEDRYPADAYHCIEFKPPGGGGGGEPKPKPEPRQDGLFPRPERSVRMLSPLPEQEPALVAP